MSDQRNEAGDLGGLAERVGNDVSGLVDREVATARSELTETAKQGAAGAGLVGGAAVTGFMALLFASISVWRGLGKHMGLGRSAALLAALYGIGAVTLSTSGGARLATLTGAPKATGALKKLASSVRRSDS